MSTSPDDPADTSLADLNDDGPRRSPAASSPPPPPAPSAAELPAPSTPQSATPQSPSLTGPPEASPPQSVAQQSLAPIGTRPGDLTGRWRVVLAVAWVLAFFAYAAIWQASVEIGIGTWWIGARAQPTPTFVRVLPSLLSISMAMCAIYNVPRLVRLSAFGVVLATIVAIPDFTRSIGLGVAELVIAGLLGVVTVAAGTGRYRLAPDRFTGGNDTSAETSDRTAGTAGNSASETHNGADSDGVMALFAPPEHP